jgi:hypothetical protein
MDTATSTARTITHASPQITIPNGISSRIPASLQAIFLASNQGAEVNDAPLDGVASMEFVRGSTTVVLEKNCLPILLSALSGNNHGNGNSGNNMNKNSSFTVTKRRVPTKLALTKPIERSKTMVCKLVTLATRGVFVRARAILSDVS